MKKHRLNRYFGQQGYLALIMVLGIAMLSFVVGSFTLTRSFMKGTSQQYRRSTQAVNVARSGVQDAIAWFRRQEQQPVAMNNRDLAVFTYPDSVFQPRFNADASLSSTMTANDEAIGLVNEFELSADTKIWARYEVKRQNAAYADTADAAYDPGAVHDVTAHRIPSRLNGEGLAWQIYCTGYVFRKVDANVPFNQAPNEVLLKARSSAEIRRLAMMVPTAAVFLNDRNSLTLTNDARVKGGGDANGIAYFNDSGAPTLIGAGHEISGALGSEVDLGAGAVAASATFEMTEDILKRVSDVAGQDAADIGPYPAMALVFVDGNAVFDAGHPLTGGGILYVSGNLQIEHDANFNGLIFVTGNAIIEAPANIRGAMIAGGNLHLDGTSGIVSVEYHPAILNQVRQSLAAYRELKTTAMEARAQ